MSLTNTDITNVANAVVATLNGAASPIAYTSETATLTPYTASQSQTELDISAGSNYEILLSPEDSLSNPVPVSDKMVVRLLNASGVPIGGNVNGEYGVKPSPVVANAVLFFFTAKHNKAGTYYLQLAIPTPAVFIKEGGGPAYSATYAGLKIVSS